MQNLYVCIFATQACLKISPHKDIVNVGTFRVLVPFENFEQVKNNAAVEIYYQFEMHDFPKL